MAQIARLDRSPPPFLGSHSSLSLDSDKEDESVRNCSGSRYTATRYATIRGVSAEGSSKKGKTGARAASLALAEDDEERCEDASEKVGEGNTTPTSLARHKRFFHFITIALPAGQGLLLLELSGVASSNQPVSQTRRPLAFLQFQAPEGSIRNVPLSSSILHNRFCVFTVLIMLLLAFLSLERRLRAPTK